MFQFRGMRRGWHWISSGRSVIFSVCLLCLMPLEGCISSPSRSFSIERELPEISSIVYFDLPDSRRVVLFHSKSVRMMPGLLVNYRGNPFFEITENYHDYAGIRALISGGSMNVRLNSKDKKLVFEKMLELDTSWSGFLSYSWERSKKLPVLVVYEILMNDEETDSNPDRQQ